MNETALTVPQALDRALSSAKAGRLVEAAQICEQIIAVKPDFFDALYVLAAVQLRLTRFDAALENFHRAITLQPNNAMAHFNLANTLQAMQRQEEALKYYDRAIELNPDFAVAYSDRGTALGELRRFEEAVASYGRAIELRPDYAVAYYNRGLALHESGRPAEAVASYERAIALRPDFAEARLNQSLSRLLTGDFERGWPGYEWRTKVKSPGNVWRNFTQPQWRGNEDISGKTIFLPAEQGFGDTIQFGRYVPMIEARGARIVLEVLPPLAALMTTLAGVSQIIVRNDPLPEFDIQCPMLSLPLAFGTRLETIPSAVPYLRAAPEHGAEWKTRLGPSARPRVGLAWSGEPTHTGDRNRSIPLASLLPLLEIDATFVSLQKDVRATDAPVLQARSDLRPCGGELKNFAETAALVSNLDLVISIDSSVAHLAGALAKPVWLLLPFVSDWRWLLDRDDSPWYPTMRLFRQDDTRAWDGVVARVQSALREFVQSRS